MVRIIRQLDLQLMINVTVKIAFFLFTEDMKECIRILKFATAWSYGIGRDTLSFADKLCSIDSAFSAVIADCSFRYSP